MYVSAKGRRELNAKIALNGFKEEARIRRERKPLGDGEGYLGGGVRKKGASLNPAKRPGRLSPFRKFTGLQPAFLGK
jgi:hypothetical protein